MPFHYAFRAIHEVSKVSLIPQQLSLVIVDESSALSPVFVFRM